MEQLFSRGSSPPGPQQPFPDLTQQSRQYQHSSPAQSFRDPAQSSSPSHVESLFHNLNASSGQSNGNPIGPPHANHSAPATPVSSMTVHSGSSVTSAPPNPTTDSRQSALLSLLGSTVPPNTAAAASGPQQVPTPPGSTHRTGLPNSNESQGRLLLEQLMSGYVFLLKLLFIVLCGVNYWAEYPLS